MFQRTIVPGTPPPSTWFIGLDLGQATDFTAIAVLEKRPREKLLPELHLQFLKRWDLGTGYPQIVADVLAILEKTAKHNAGQHPLRGSTLGIDNTGVGRGITDMFVAARPPCRLQPVTITGGQQCSRDGAGWHVPKKDLVGATIAALQTKRLAWDPRLPFDAILAKELASFETRLSAAGNEQFGSWREGQHDDLVLAAAIACWLAERATPARPAGLISGAGMGNATGVLHRGTGGFQW